MEEMFEVGKTYPFEVVGLRPSGFGNYNIFLKRGNRDTYRVKAFPFQIDDPDIIPEKMDCIVMNVDVITGLPYLHQEKGSMLKRLYLPGEEYPFKVSAIITDLKTNAEYYLLTDHLGLEHRYYFKGEKRHQLYDIFSLKVEKIDENKGVLIFSEIPEAVVKGTQVIETTDFGIEDLHTEFKSSIVFVPGTNDANIDKQLQKIIRTIAAFMNAEGGTLWLGLNDSGNVTGIEEDFQFLNSGDDENNGSYRNTPDSYELKIRNCLNRNCGSAAGTKAYFHFYTNQLNKLYCKIDIKSSTSPVFVNGTYLFQRAGNQVVQLKGEEITSFIKARYTDEISGIFGKRVEISSSIEREDNPVPGNSVINIPAPIVPAASVLSDEVWNHFTFYKDGKWSFQKNDVHSDAVEYELPIKKSQKDHLMMMCYDNGCINVVVPSRVRSKKERGKMYANGWNTDARLLDIFISPPFNLIGVFSLDNEGVKRVKVHSVTDFNPVESLRGKGSMIVNPALGKVQQFKLVQIENKGAIPDLILEKRLTSQSLGFRTTEPAYRAEIEFLEKL